MRRTIFVILTMVVLIGVFADSIGAAYSPHRSFSGHDYGYAYRGGAWHREPVIRVDVGYHYGDCRGYGGYYGGYGWYGRGNAQNSYPQSSILSIIGLPDYNSEQYWAYHNKIVDRDKEQSQSTGCPYVSDQQLLERANQAGRIQKLEEKIAELEAKLNAKPTK